MTSYDGAELEVLGHSKERCPQCCMVQQPPLHTEHRHDWFSRVAVPGMRSCVFSWVSISTMTFCSYFFQVKKTRVSC